VFVGKEGGIWYSILDTAADSRLGGVATFAAMLPTPSNTTHLKLFMTLVYICYTSPFLSKANVVQVHEKK